MTTWNAADLLDVALSNGDLTLTPTSSVTHDCGARASKGLDTGKFYFELTAVSTVNTAGTSLASAGVAKANTAFNLSGGSLPAGMFGWDFGIGSQTIGIAVDLDAGTLDIIDGSGTTNIAASGVTGDIFFPIFETKLTSSEISITANFGASAFTFAVPSGYSSWDSGTAASFTALRNTSTYLEVLSAGAGGEARVTSTFVEVLRSVEVDETPAGIDLQADITDDLGLDASLGLGAIAPPVQTVLICI